MSQAIFYWNFTKIVINKRRTFDQRSMNKFQEKLKFTKKTLKRQQRYKYLEKYLNQQNLQLKYFDDQKFIILSINRMSLKKYMPCDEGHSADFEYVCLKEKRVFCIKCWCKFQHYRYCQSSRCGQYSKIAHLALNRSLQYKNAKLLEALCGSKETYEQLRVRFLQLNFQISEMMKEFVEQKMPLLLWSMINSLLKAKTPSQDLQNYFKFDSVSTQMIRIIKSNDRNSCQQYLEKSIGAYFDINHQIQGDMNVFRNSTFTRKNHKEDQVNEIMQKIKINLNDMLNNIKKNVRKSIDDQLQKVTTIIDPQVKYKGIVFQKNSQYDSFKKREDYPFINLLAQEYSRITNEQNQLYNGFHLSIPQLQNNPEQLLQVSKCFIKDRLFSVYDSINSVKSVFPYKFAYPISTTLTSDQDYESLIIDLEKTSLQSTDTTSPFLCSLTLVVMGRELIVIRLYNHPKFCYSLKIYNHKPQRIKYYDKLIEKLGLKNFNQRSNSGPDIIEFTEDLTDTQLVYCHFRTAYETIFLCHTDELVFEGERVMANRGAQQFANVIEKWRTTAQIDLPFNRSMPEMIKLFI